MFDIGQKVMVVKSKKVKKGRTGMVAAISEDNTKHIVGVFLSKNLTKNGHDLDGNCPDGYGLWFAEDQLVALVD